MEIWQLIIVFIVGSLASVASGIAGAGGGFIMTPLFIAFGLSPAQAVSTGKIAGFMVTVGALGGLRNSKDKVAKKKIAFVMFLALIVGLLSPYAIKSLDSEIYRVALGVILLLMIPIVLIKKVGLTSSKVSRSRFITGSFLLTGALALQGIFSGGLGAIVNLVLMGMFGMNATEANITKRWSQLILNSAIVIGVISSGLIVWEVALVMLPATLGGSYIGAHIAVKKGNAFIMNVMVVLMALSALYLIFGM